MAIGRSDTMQELITLMESLFDETIIGSDINIVRHLFYHLKADNREFDFIYNDVKSLAVVEDIMLNTVLLAVNEFSDAGIRRATIRFEIMNILYQFEILIQDVRNNKLVIKIPSELQSVQLRQNKRIPVDDLFMSFIILFRSLEGGARSVGKNLYAESRFPHLMKEIRRDKPDLKLINIMLTDYIRKISPDYEITFFNATENTSKIQDLIRSVLSRTEKSIYISDTSRMESYLYPLEDEFLCNYSDEYLRLKIALDEDEVIDYFKDIQKKENRDFIVSYVCTPIRIYDEVIGYIRIYTTAMDRYSITHPQALFLHELSEIINYAFTKVAIQLTSYKEYVYSTKIVDISMNGLLFEINNPRLFNFLKKHNVIKMNIPIYSNRILVMRGVIVRFIERAESYFLGVNFFDSNPDDMLHLSNYLFEKSMNIFSG